MSANRRDEKLRRDLLDLTRKLGGRSANGWVTGSKLAIAARDSAGNGVDSDAHAGRLIEDLVSLDLIAEKDREPTGGIGDRELRHRLFKITDLGWRMVMNQIDPMPGIAGRDD